MRVTKPAYEWTGEHRPPRKGELFAASPPGEVLVYRCGQDFDKPRDIYGEVQREHEVPDPVPGWIVAALAGGWSDHMGGVAHVGPCHTCRLREESVARAFRRLVEERAAMAAERIAGNHIAGCKGYERETAAIVREEFLK